MEHVTVVTLDDLTAQKINLFYFQRFWTIVALLTGLKTPYFELLTPQITLYCLLNAVRPYS